MVYKRIDSKSNSVITECAKLNMKKYRESTGTFFTEGKKLAREAFDAGCKPLKVIYSEEFLTENVNFCNDIEKRFGNDTEYFVTKIENLRKITSQDAPEGVVCVFLHIDKIKKIDKINTYMRTRISDLIEKRVMVLESIRDPGNLGTMIRTALAFGIDELFITPDCADLYSLKTLRGAMGAIFRQSITICDSIYAVDMLKECGKTVYAAALHKESVPLTDLDVSVNTSFVIGNEANGLREETIEHCDGCVIIPMGEHSESLNASVAASVFMWELSKNK